MGFSFKRIDEKNDENDDQEQNEKCRKKSPHDSPLKRQQHSPFSVHCYVISRASRDVFKSVSRRWRIIMLFRRPIYQGVS